MVSLFIQYRAIFHIFNLYIDDFTSAKAAAEPYSSKSGNQPALAIPDATPDATFPVLETASDTPRTESLEILQHPLQKLLGKHLTLQVHQFYLRLELRMLVLWFK